jgi:hypothetical protein
LGWRTEVDPCPCEEPGGDGIAPQRISTSYMVAGEQSTLVGFGRYDPSAASDSRKRWGGNWVTGAGASIVRFDSSYWDATSCFGDSGGPWYRGGYGSDCVGAHSSSATWECDLNYGPQLANFFSWISAHAIGTVYGCDPCGDGVCQSHETQSSCPGDCEPPPDPCGGGGCGGNACGDGVCDVYGGECTENCAQDCGWGVYCQ